MMLPLFLAAALTVDAQNHAVSFEVVSADPGANAPIEFLVTAPGSDHDYETLFTTVADAKALAEAFARAGFPRGSDIDYAASRFWPVGGEVVFEPDLKTLVRDLKGDDATPPVLYTGGARLPDGTPEAATNMPLAVFALYDCPQSLFQFNDALSQSATYGRFVPATVIPAGERRILKVTWKGAAPAAPLTLRLEPGKLADALTGLKARSEKGEVSVLPDFAPDLTVAEAAEAAAALAVVDSVRVKVNGHPAGQFFYRAFLPLERWRDRTERLAQPYEVRLRADGSAPVLTVIKEDWSDPDASDPKLIVTENAPFDSIGKDGDLTDTALIFAPRTMKVADVFAVRKLLPPRVLNYYVYGD